jgi:hypothetical protein
MRLQSSEKKVHMLREEVRTLTCKLWELTQELEAAQQLLEVYQPKWNDDEAKKQLRENGQEVEGPRQKYSSEGDRILCVDGRAATSGDFSEGRDETQPKKTSISALLT